MSVINLSTAARLDINVDANYSYELALEHYEDDETTPITLLGTYSMKIMDQSDNLLETLVEGNGISKTGHILYVSRTTLNNLLARGTYKYEIREDLPGDISNKRFKGLISVNGSL